MAQTMDCDIDGQGNRKFLLAKASAPVRALYLYLTAMDGGNAARPLERSRPCR
ncbi:MAG: hypothetical protein PHF31_10575 [Methylobacter sp.]|nr:hypothetical protein [Methylobacter sp.]